MACLILIGFMGAGKTTIGNLLAEKTAQPQYDLDQLIVEHTQMSIPEYFEQFGSDAFRKLETQVLKQAQTLDGILSTGGGIVLAEENRALLKSYPPVVYLKADFPELLQRVQQDEQNQRPLADGKTSEQIEELYSMRIPLYEESAHLTIETTGKTPEQIVNEILEQVGE